MAITSVFNIKGEFCTSNPDQNLAATSFEMLGWRHTSTEMNRVLRKRDETSHHSISKTRTFSQVVTLVDKTDHGGCIVGHWLMLLHVNGVS